VFLGITFMYAGIQKLVDPNYLNPGTRTYIGSQLHDFAQGSPIRSMMLGLAHFPFVVGVGVALLELAVGLATLLGVAPLAWALVGFLINAVLFLSASWRVHPYFLGSDSIYAIAWAAYAAGCWEIGRRFRREPPGRRIGGARTSSQPVPPLARREVLRGAGIALGALLLGGIARALAGSPSAAPTSASLRSSPSPPRGPSDTATPAGPNPSGTIIARLDSVPVGGAIAFDDPARGPAALFRLGPSHVVAYSRICTHAGCEVGYDPQARLLYCPCHGAEFDPAHGARVVAGPAPIPLPAIPVAIDRRSGEIVAQS
jgi:thiosulfate dehydrogenase [quinone] large subunit